MQSKAREATRVYPWLGKNKYLLKINYIVLFISQSNGTVVWIDEEPTKSRYVGYNTDTWDEDSFIEFHGEVILSNEVSKNEQ